MLPYSSFAGSMANDVSGCYATDVRLPAPEALFFRNFCVGCNISEADGPFIVLDIGRNARLSY